MIVFLLLVIVAILLFGSSAVLGAVGAIFGFIALVLALFFGAHTLSLAFDISTENMLMYGAFGFLILVALAHLYKASRGSGGPRRK